MMKQLFIYGLFFLSLAGFAQKKDKHLTQGNDDFSDKSYSSAEAEYRQSLAQNQANTAAAYNLGNSIYRQNQPAEAKYSFAKAVKSAQTKEQKYQAYHNLGNSLMQEKDYSGAVEAYKNALRNNPSDEQTRYNFALAKKMLKDNPPKQDKKDDKKENKKDNKQDQKKQDQDKKDDPKQDQNKDQKDKKEGNQDKKDDQGNQDQPNQPKPKPGGISKERLQNLLDAVNNEEKKIQDKVNAKKVKGRPVQTEKDW
ncbi:MAG: tetratricopeptide repeat protein [Flavobacteriaceae bacterium]